MNNKAYDILKWVALICLPALAVLVGTIGSDIGFEYTNIIVNIINAVAVFIGALIGASTINYNKK